MCKNVVLHNEVGRKSPVNNLTFSSTPLILKIILEKAISEKNASTERR